MLALLGNVLCGGSEQGTLGDGLDIGLKGWGCIPYML